MLVFRGAPAFSDFRLHKLEKRLTTDTGQTIQVYAEHMHFADLDNPLTTDQKAVLERLLRYGPQSGRAQIRMGGLVLVVPRPGTISPWSSKATDIARQLRAEQGQAPGARVAPTICSRMRRRWTNGCAPPRQPCSTTA